MNEKRKIEIFSAGCSACDDVVDLIQKIACPSCEVQVLDMHKPDVAAKAKTYGVMSVPAVAVNGKLAGCCAGRSVDEATLRREGIGVAL
jgi:alkyl hydroperoxide reductase subunit AhpF